MLIRIVGSNILSFNSEAEFSMIPGKGSLKTEHVVKGESRDDIPVLRAGILYGANASGKSNLVRLAHIIQSIATKTLQANQDIPVEQFKLGGNSGTDSSIETEIKIGSKYYAYGVTFNKKRIKEEWLYDIHKRKEKPIFIRKTNNQGTRVEFDNIEFANEEDKQFAAFVGRGTPPNRSFLKECKERNLDFATPVNDVYNWFDNKLKVFFPKTRFKGLEFQLDRDRGLSQSMSKLLSYFQTGVERLIAVEVDPGKDIKEFPAPMISDIITNLARGKRMVISSEDDSKSYAFEKDRQGVTKVYKLVTERQNKKGEAVYFEMSEESDGTRRIIDFIPMLMDLMKNDAVYLVDEIDRSMHPILTKGIFSFFINNCNDRESQMIATTHEANLLDLELFRKDEIWFVEKNREGASRLYSLLEFKPRADKDISRGYLNGRYGAIPFLTNPKDLHW